MLCDKAYYFVYASYSHICIIVTVGNDVTSATQKQVPINMKDNVAYEVPSSRIKMTENKSYSTLPTVDRP